MRTVIAFALVVSAATAAAETKIIEYPDHYYAESTGTPMAKPASTPDSTAAPVSAPPAVDYEKPVPPRRGVAARGAVPFTNFDAAPNSVDPAEQRSEMSNEIERLQRERSQLQSPQAGEAPEQAALREKKASGLLRRINRLSSELQKIPQP